MFYHASKIAGITTLTLYWEAWGICSFSY